MSEELTQAYTTEKSYFWNTYGDQIKELTEVTWGPEGCGPILGITDEVVIASDLEAILTDPNSIIAVVADNYNNILGFSYAIPADKFDPDADRNNAIYLYDIIVAENYRGQKIAPSLINAIILEAYKQDYELVELHAVTEGNWAQKIIQNAGDSITEKIMYKDFFELGEQAHIVINIRQYLINQLLIEP